MWEQGLKIVGTVGTARNSTSVTHDFLNWISMLRVLLWVFIKQKFPLQAAKKQIPIFFYRRCKKILQTYKGFVLVFSFYTVPA
jgi:hypothetical protein